MPLKLDLSQTLLLRESAGGYLAVQLALSHPSDIQALVALYPVLDPRSKFYTTSYEKPMHGIWNRLVSIVDYHIASLQSALSGQRLVVTEADPLNCLQQSYAVVQHGWYLDFLGQDRELFPIERFMDSASSEDSDGDRNIPPVFIFHGKDDTFEPYQGTLRFVEALGKTHPFAKYRWEIQPGDHRFDADANIKHTPWLKE
ncbi:hypothetical protein BJY01DRAFT_248672 [Aspergillus pseudoustus]|uniref:Alpha/Beta hydrolase protein n=1 Tax=Aspergillus pseudoustus TaxID=1810923 RepID=A0ABR4JTK7_9EURO